MSAAWSQTARWAHIMKRNIKMRPLFRSTEEIFIGADFGPVGELEEQSASEVLRDYRQMCDVFLACGAKVFVFESQRDDKYVKQLADYVKERLADALVLVQYTFDNR